MPCKVCVPRNFILRVLVSVGGVDVVVGVMLAHVWVAGRVRVCLGKVEACDTLNRCLRYLLFSPHGSELRGSVSSANRAAVVGVSDERVQGCFAFSRGDHRFKSG